MLAPKRISWLHISYTFLAIAVLSLWSGYSKSHLPIKILYFIPIFLSLRILWTSRKNK
ncbi:hypothetical protein ATPR_0466 [Acetobacter tropicalis NBRC 101654]|uniref:Uncharacterized protein n=1 Tax=Acetobacter tropicalis NBRC 101654 TaxID=749388 RepID=F7VAR7_9PROT|nr:hypothetical protein ATPR_0466 [Acetobacter tropicalis NBRC 101654]